MALYRSHPDHLASLPLTRADELSDALEFLSGLEENPTSRAERLSGRISVQPFLPAVDNLTLVELFAGNPSFPEGATLQATASFVERLQRLAVIVD